MIKGFTIRVADEGFVIDKGEDDTDFVHWKKCDSMQEALEEIRVEWERVEG